MTDQTGVAPAILKLYPGLDPGQLELISHTDGPTLGIAGPGSGKTLSAVLRGLNILQSGLARPEELLLCTYSKAAAAELRQRFDAVARAAGYGGDTGRVRVSTIHSLCGRLVASYPERVGLRPGFGVLDRQEQWRFLYDRFDTVFGPDLGDLEGRGWLKPPAVARNGLKYFDRICDEVIFPEDLIRSGSRFIAALGRCYLRYERLLLRENVADFAHLQAWADLLLDDDDLTHRMSAGIRYLLCDEYQDTSHLQERLLLRLSEVHGNLCVIGDEDQSLYRFRGASVRNILGFAQRFPGCRVVELNVNYRSHPEIIRAYGGWMLSGDWSNPDAQGAPFRRAKTIVPHAPEKYDDYPAVIAVDGLDSDDEGEQLADLLRFLKRRRVIASYDQVVLLLRSVRDEVAAPYLEALESARIPARCVSAGGGRGRRGRKRSREGVTVTTIHQAKGREWPVVIVGSLDFHNSDVDPVGRLLRPYFRRPDWEPPRRIAAFDHMRQHYVGFSRPRDLLVLSASEPVHPRFDAIWGDTPRWTELDHSQLSALARQRFRTTESGAGTGKAPPTQTRVIPRLKRLDVQMGLGWAAHVGGRVGYQECPEERARSRQYHQQQHHHQEV